MAAFHRLNGPAFHDVNRISLGAPAVPARWPVTIHSTARQMSGRMQTRPIDSTSIPGLQCVQTRENDRICTYNDDQHYDLSIIVCILRVPYNAMVDQIEVEIVIDVCYRIR